MRTLEIYLGMDKALYLKDIATPKTLANFLERKTKGADVRRIG